MARQRIRIERAGQGAFPLAGLNERPPPPFPWLRTILAAVLGLGLVAGAGIATLRALLDTEILEAQALQALRHVTGREVRFGGRLVVDSLAQARIAVDDVVIPGLARIARLEAELSRGSLLFGTPVIERLVIDSPDIQLAIDANGRGNWRSPDGAVPQPAATPPLALPRSIHLKDGRLVFTDARAGRTTTLALRRITLADAESGGLVAVAADLAYGTQRVSATGQVGPLARLADTTATTAWPLRLAIESQGSKLTVAGGIQRPLDLAGYALKLDAWVADTSTLAGLVPYRLPSMRTVSLTARIADTDGPVPDIAGARLQMGASDLTAWVPGLKFDTAEIVMPGLEQPVRAEALGTLNGVPIRLQATLGGPAALLPGHAEDSPFFPVDIAAEAGESRLALKGGIAAVGRRTGMDIAVSGRVTDLELLSPLVGQRLPRLLNLALEARLGDGPGGFAESVALRGLSLTGPQGDLGGDLVLHHAPRWGLSGTLRGTKLDADALYEVLTDAFGTPELAERPSPFRRRAWDDTKVIANHRFHLDPLRQADADLTLSIGHVAAFGTTWQGVAGPVRLERGRLALGPLIADLPTGRASLGLTVDAGDPRTPVTLAAAIPGIPVQPLLAGSTRRDNLFGQLEVDADLRAEGDTWRALAGTVSGRLGLSVVEGDIDSRMLLQPLSGIMGAAHVPLNLTTQMGTLARLRCFAARLDAERGKTAVTSLVLESGRVLLQADGGFDLGAEELAVRLRSSFRAGGRGVSVPVRFIGTFERPRMELEPGDPARTAEVVREDAPDACLPALALARAGRAGPAPSERNARPSLVAPPPRRPGR